MGISSAFSIAAAGLRATSVQSDLVARNISNAQTEGYARKSADLTTRSGAVVVAGIRREVDPLLERLDRSNRSDVQRALTISGALASYTGYLGQPDDETSPVNGLNRLYTSLLTLSSAPATAAAQLGVVEAARALTGQINDLGVTLNELSREVELNIRYDVAAVNETLERLAQINGRLSQIGGDGVEGADLRDESARLLDTLSDYIDLQTTTSADGSVNVYTSGGTELLIQRRASPVRFDPTSGTLMAGEFEITPGKEAARGLRGGSLAGLFELKDTLLPEIRAELDGFATGLVTRFQAADGTLTGGENGLFMLLGGGGPQGGDAAARLVVNALYDPAQGGDAARLVEGGGSGPGLPKGDAGFVTAMMGAIDERRPGAGPFGEGLSLADYATAMVAGHQQRRVTAEQRTAQAQISGATISASRQNLQGVNIDDELQVLMVIEQSFAANSRVLTSLQSMMDDLMNAI